MCEATRKYRQSLIDKALMLGYSIRKFPGISPEERPFALMRDGMWISAVPWKNPRLPDAPLAATFRAPWLAAKYALEREGVDVRTPKQRRDAGES